MKKVLKIFATIISFIILLAMVFLGFLTFAEYRPKKLETLKPTGNALGKVKIGEEISFVIYNTGYASLGKIEDFVMDGGIKGRADNKEVVLGYLAGIKDFFEAEEHDFYLIQEVDYNSRRSYYTDQITAYADLFENYNSTFALNYKARFVPFPFSFTDYFGKVNSGIQTLSNYEIDKAYRHQLPGSFSWPIRTVNLKRALLVNYYEIENSDKQLVVVNVHLSAYDDGSMRAKEMQYLKEFLIAEKEKGNYIVVGGDFNQTPQIAQNLYPVGERLWTPPIIAEDFLPEGFSFQIDLTIPTCRLLNKPYENSNHQHYIIDGFIVSDNITVNLIQTHDLGFVNSDHNPVSLKIVLT